jgi:twitching motility protein PilT
MELTELLKELVERNGSDLHLVAGSSPIIRINGTLMPTKNNTAVLGKDEVAKLLEPFLSEARNAMLRNKQDVNASVVSDSFVSEQYGRASHFRTCAFWDRNGLSASLRVIPWVIPTMQQLFSSDTEATFRKLINLRRGLIILVGMTGSGKSTTTASLIDAINSERCERIFTIEDPIEYVHVSKLSLISQREVGTDIDSFEQGGLSVMRSDPDVVLVAEFRTPEAVRIALAMAETGHLVFATLHADCVSEAVRRLVESFPENRETMQRMIARSLNAVIAQRLVPRANGTGRVPVHEIMIVNSRIRRMISEGETDLSLAIEAGRDEGMRTMDDSAIQLYRDGTIDYDKAWNIVQDRDRLGLAQTQVERTVGEDEQGSEVEQLRAKADKQIYQAMRIGKDARGIVSQSLIDDVNDAVGDFMSALHGGHIPAAREGLGDLNTHLLALSKAFYAARLALPSWGAVDLLDPNVDRA